MNEAEFVSQVQAAFETQLSEVRTTCPGKLVSYDNATNRAVVKPSLPKALADGRDLDSPNIHEVPVAWPMGGGFIMTWPLRPGDGLTLSFAERSLEGWLSGNDRAPDDPRRFDISDCIAEPNLKATGVSPDNNSVVMSFSGGEIRMEGNGVIRMKGSRMFIEMPVQTTSTVETGGNILSHGRVDADSDIVASQKVSLLTHRHSASGGTGTGGPPVV